MMRKIKAVRVLGGLALLGLTELAVVAGMALTTAAPAQAQFFEPRYQRQRSGGFFDGGDFGFGVVFFQQGFGLVGEGGSEAAGVAGLSEGFGGLDEQSERLVMIAGTCVEAAEIIFH